MSLTDAAITHGLVLTRLRRILKSVAELRAAFGPNEQFDEIERDASSAIQELTSRPRPQETE